MITPASLAEALRRNVTIIKLQSRGLSTDQSLQQLPFRANCLNWVLGHLVTNRLAMIKILSGSPAPEAELLARYERESDPVTGPGEGVISLEELLRILEETQARLEMLIEKTTVAQWAEPVLFAGGEPNPRSEWLFFLYFHDCYHTGQTELLRQAAGMNDKVI